MMELQEKVSSLSSINGVVELNQLILYPNVTISWWGKRLVSVRDYTGTVEIRELAEKYLAAASFEVKSSPTLRDRFNCANLYSTIQTLYNESDDQLKRSWCYWLFVPAKESIGLADASAEWQKQASEILDQLYMFTPEEFQKHWPEKDPDEVVLVKENEIFSEKWIASYDRITRVVF